MSGSGIEAFGKGSGGLGDVEVVFIMQLVLTVLVWLYVATLGAAMASAEPPATMSVVEARAEPPATQPTPAWYTGTRYYWNRRLFRGERYADIAKRLPIELAQAKSALNPRDLIPMDCAEGPDRPRITYILAYATDATLKQYLGIGGLEYLDLYYSKLSNDGLAQLRQSRVRSLTLPQDGMSNTAIKELFSNQESLRELNHLEIEAAGEALTRDVLSVLPNMGRLRSIQLSGDRITDAWVEKLAQMPHLSGVRLYKTSATDRGLAALCQAGNLTHLSITYCKQITPDGLKALQNLPELKELHLVGSKITDASLLALKNNPGIEVLVLESESITEQGIANLATLPKLNTLVIMDADNGAVRTAATAWEQAKDARRAFLNPDVYLGGWVSGLEGQWVNLRGYNPQMFP